MLFTGYFSVGITQWSQYYTVEWTLDQGSKLYTQSLNAFTTISWWPNLIKSTHSLTQSTQVVALQHVWVRLDVWHATQLYLAYSWLAPSCCLLPRLPWVGSHTRTLMAGSCGCRRQWPARRNRCSLTFSLSGAFRRNKFVKMFAVDYWQSSHRQAICQAIC